MKEYRIYAGVNGAGKSTLYSTYPLLQNMKRVNTDEIICEIGGSWQDINSMIQAGRIAVERVKEYFANEESFSQETTLCGKSILNTIRKAKENNYRVVMYYVCVESVEIAKERVKMRVSQGGHGISEADIERRYYESLKNLPDCFSLCDEIVFYDNTDRFYKIAELTNNLLVFDSIKKPRWYKDNIESPLMDYCNQKKINIISSISEGLSRKVYIQQKIATTDPRPLQPRGPKGP